MRTMEIHKALTQQARCAVPQQVLSLQKQHRSPDDKINERAGTPVKKGLDTARPSIASNRPFAYGLPVSKPATTILSKVVKRDKSSDFSGAILGMCSGIKPEPC